MKDDNFVISENPDSALLEFSDIQKLEELSDLESYFTTFHRLPCGCCLVLMPNSSFTTWKLMLALFCKSHYRTLKVEDDYNVFYTWYLSVKS